MKRNIRLLLYFIVNIITWLRLNFYQIKNLNRPRVFFYTDSRGFEISKIKNRKNPFSSYIKYYIKNYNCSSFVCPEKHTTIFDFLYQLYISSKSHKYKYVISQIGVVDFSPRPISDLTKIYQLKKDKIIRLFGADFYQKLINQKKYKETYLGQETSSILTDDLLPFVAKKFNDIDNFIWISCNPIDITWRGNYKKNRPTNINIVNEMSKQLINLMKESVQVVNLTQWSNKQVHSYTSDNIHFSNKGMKFIENEIQKFTENEPAKF